MASASQGTLIPVITFSALDNFDGVFQPFKRYYIANASVRAVDPRYKICEYDYAWTLYPRTYVQLIDDPKPYVSAYSFDFIKLSEMFRVADWDVQVGEDASFKKTQPSSKLVRNIAELVLHDSTSPANEKEKQLFSHDTIRVFDEIATKVGVDEATPLAIGVFNKGMAVNEAHAGTEGDMTVERVPYALVMKVVKLLLVLKSL